jgi:hypothetical protein
MKKQEIKKLAGVRPVRNLLAADAGDYLKVRGETVVVVQRLVVRGRNGLVEWHARKANGVTIILSAKDAAECTRPTLEEALMVRTVLALSGNIIPVSAHLQSAPEAEQTAATG